MSNVDIYRFLNKQKKEDEYYRFYVYAYIRLKDSKTAKAGTPYYIGKGQGDRLTTNHKHIRFNKSNIVIISHSLSEIGALALERRLIAIWGRKCDGTGILRNLTNGGDGASLHNSYDKSGENNPMYGKNHSEETREKIRKARIGKPGTPHSEAHKLKMKLENNGGIATRTPILQFSTDGDLVKRWNSITEAANHFKNSKANISSVAKSHLHRLCFGFYWRFEDSDDIIDCKLKNIDQLNCKRLSAKHTKIIYQKDLNGYLIKEWNSIQDISNHFGISYSIIWSRIQTGKPIENDIFSYK